MSPETQGQPELTAAQNFRRAVVQAVTDGSIPAGTPLPPVRVMAKKHGVSVKTVVAAMRDLKKKEMIESKPRHGNFVLGKQSKPKPRKSRSGTGRRIAMLNLPGNTGNPASWEVPINLSFERTLLESGYEPSKPPNFPDRSADRAELGQWLDDAGQLQGALIFADPRNTPPLIAELDERSIPWVTINRTHLRARHNFVAADTRDYARVLGKTLARSGVERLLFVEPSTHASLTPIEAKTGIAQGYFEAGAKRCPLEVLTHAFDGIRELAEVTHDAVRDYLKHNPPPQVMLGWTHFGGGALRACRELGLRVPDDVGVINIHHVDAPTPGLPAVTQVTIDNARLGREAALMLLHMVRQRRRPAPTNNTVWPAGLQIVREHLRVLGRYVPGTLTFRDTFRVSEDVWKSLKAEEEPHFTKIERT